MAGCPFLHQMVLCSRCCTKASVLEPEPEAPQRLYAERQCLSSFLSTPFRAGLGLNSLYPPASGWRVPPHLATYESQVLLELRIAL